jgi:hypothetical protein
MRKIFLILVLVSNALAATTTLTGTIKDSAGRPLNGTLTMRLPVPAQDTATSTAVAPTPVTFQLVNGVITGGAPLYDVLGLQPQNLYYIARAYDQTGALQFYGYYNVTGATYNLGAATPTTVTTSNVSYANVPFLTAVNVFTAPLGVTGISVPVEAFGAVGDWNGATGTDNTAAIQACLNSLSSGVCSFQAKSYKITGTLTINKSGVGISGVDSFQADSAVFTSNPSLSTLVSTSASADILDITGVSTSSMLSNNTVKNITLARSVVPSGTAKGLNLSFSYKAQIQNVVSQDSIYDFYFRGVGSFGSGYIENNIASWGLNGVTETSGSLYGFYVDTSGGVFSPSIRIRNNHVASNLGAGAFTTYGYANVGTLGADWHLLHDESAGVNYGIYLNNSGSGFTASSDIQIIDPIMDGCLTACIFSTGLSGSISVTGGWLNPQGASAVAADFESGGVGSMASFYNTTIFGTGLTGGTAAIIGHNSYNLQLVGNKIQTQTSSIPAISFNGVTGGTIEGNTIWSTAGTTTLINLVNTINVPISSNTLNGNSTNGIVLDSATHGIGGLETNTCGASVASITNCIVDSGGNYHLTINGSTWTATAGVPSANCNVGDIDTNKSAGSASTVFYVCAPANTWTAVTVP